MVHCEVPQKMITDDYALSCQGSEVTPAAFAKYVGLLVSRVLRAGF